MFGDKMKNIDLEVLLARPPPEKYQDRIMTSNFEGVEAKPYHQRDLWKKWEEKYTFPNHNNDLVEQALKTENRKIYTMVNSLLFGYFLSHFATKYTLKRRGTEEALKNWRWFKNGKYLALLAAGAGYYYGMNKYMDELKDAGIYEYKEKRAALYRDVMLARRMWQYGKQRA